MRSIRRHLLWTLLLGVLISTVASGHFVYTRTQRLLIEQYDAVLLSKSKTLLSMLEVDEGYLEFNYADAFMREFEVAGTPHSGSAVRGADDQDAAEYFEIWYGEASVRTSGTLKDGQGLPRQVGALAAPAFFDLILPDGRSGRAIGVFAPVILDDEQDDALGAAGPGAGDGRQEEPAEPNNVADVQVDLVVARSRSELDHALARLRGTLFLSGGALGVLVLLVVFLGVGRGLRPIAQLGQEVAAIGPARLSARVVDTNLPIELAGMATKLNELLARLEAAFLRERRVTGNIAHELRTPISELRAAAEVARRWPDDPELAMAAIETAAAVSVRMGNLIDGLLRLARIASGEATERKDPIDLGALVEDCWVSHAKTARRRGIQFVNRSGQGPLILSDRDLLAHAISNLLENAAHHGSAGSTIVCESEVDPDGRFRWSVDNETEGLSEEDLAHLTEPFWQKDAARSDGHSGLGLALVSSIANALDMTLDLELTESARGQALRLSLRGETTSNTPPQRKSSTAA